MTAAHAATCLVALLLLAATTGVVLLLLGGMAIDAHRAGMARLHHYDRRHHA